MGAKGIFSHSVSVCKALPMCGQFCGCSQRSVETLYVFANTFNKTGHKYTQKRIKFQVYYQKLCMNNL